ncbi:MAG: STAS domain-containing protein [Roseobacter sp.]
MSDPIVLAPKLDLAASSALLSTLNAHKSEDVVVDLSDVKHLGALCMQVLLAAATTAQASGKSFSLTNTSDRVLEQMRVMGMTPEAISRGRQ